MRNFFICLLILACGGCDSSPSRIPTIASVNGKAITQPEFKAYLTFKRVPHGNAEDLKKITDPYIEREALAAMIAKEDILDEALLMAEVNEFRKDRPRYTLHLTVRPVPRRSRSLHFCTIIGQSEPA